jgi:predicted permease
VAVSVVLLVGAGLLIRALWRVSSIDPGFRTDGIVTLRTALPFPRYAEPVDRERFYEEVLARVRALPGVEAAGYTGFLPFVMRGIVWPIGLDDGPPPGDGVQPLAVFREVTAGYLETLGVPVLGGRHFGPQDTATSVKVAIVNRSFAQQFWPGRDPVGQTFMFQVPALRDRWTVAGVVPDFLARSLEGSPMPQVFVLHRQLEVAGAHAPRDLAVRYRGDTALLLPELRRIIGAADPEVPIASVRTLAAIVHGETTDRRHQLRLLAAFAGLAFLMAALGIYGVLAFLVSQRTQEIGVRIALGARRGDVVRMVLGRGFLLSSGGLVLGVAGGLVLGNAMRNVLFGIEPFDPPVFVSSAALCSLAALAACGVPAWRAARVDPLTALRAE